MNTAREWHTATLLPNGLVLVAGGINASGNAVTNAELYNPLAGTWTNTRSLSEARAYHAATLLPTGQAIVFGGFGNDNYAYNFEAYNPSTGSWTTNTGFPWLYETATPLPNGPVLLTGGVIGG